MEKINTSNNLEIAEKQDVIVESWKKCLKILKDNVDNKQVFKTWFEPIRPISIENNLLVLGVPSQFFYEWIEEHYAHLLNTTIIKVFNESTTIQYQIVFDNNYDDNNKRIIKLPGFRKTNLENQVSLPLPAINLNEKNYDSNLNSNFTFDNFIEGDSNQLARSAAIAISKNPGKTRFNPILIYGSTGLGKTHLVHSIGNYIMNSKNMQVKYTDSERFTQDFITSIQNNNVQEFLNIYRNVDVLIIDDIQFFSGKDKTQDNFFHTFNHLYNNGKQIILTSDRDPSLLTDIDDRLISRFKSGLVADIKAPDYEMRLAILQKKSYAEGIELPFEVADYIARNVKTNIRELEGYLIMLIAKVTLDRKTLNLELAKEVCLGSNKQVKREINVDTIKSIVSKYYNIDIELIESVSRKQEIALARHMSIYFTKMFTQMPLKAIGKSFGNRDHSTILHSCKTLENYIETDTKVRQAYQNLLDEIKKI